MPSGKKVYLVRFRSPITGRWTQTVLGDASAINADHARDEAKTKLAQVLQGNDPILAKRDKQSSVPTLRRFLDTEYAPWIKATKRAGASTIGRLEKGFAEFMNLRLNQFSVIQ